MLHQIPTKRFPATELRQICDELEQRLSAGQASSAEAMFAEHPGLSDDGDAVLEVIYTEFVTREHLAQRPSPADFCARFPQWHDELAQLFQIHGAIGASLAPNSTSTPLPAADRLRRVSRPALLDGQEGPPADLRRIAGYEILGEIGRGGMGVVYKARQVVLNRLVALKMILSGVDAGPQERARFRAEAEAAARLQHPNIVQIYEVGEHDGRPFLCLEYVDGGNLEKLLNGKPWQAPDAARLIETLARAMHYAHQQTVVHRDLKPANVLLSVAGSGLTTDNGQTTTIPKITDFGLARRLPEGDTGAAQATGPTKTGAIVGTPAYMAPEQAAGDGRAIGPAADVHALGAILYELLTGRPPFQGVTVLETLEHVRTRDPLPPGRLAPAFPRDLETICLKCLEKEPGRRYASALALAEDLARFQRGEPILARPTPAWEKAWKWARRRPVVAALLTAVVALTITGLTSVTILWQQTAAALVTVQKERDDKEAALASKLVLLAERDWLANDLDAARRHLDECPPAHRGPDWRRLHRACHACLFELGDSSRKPVARVIWSPEGRSLVTLGGGTTVWDVATRRERFTLPAQKNKFVVNAACDPDGFLVTVSRPSAATREWAIETQWWNLETGQEARSQSVTTPAMNPALSANGRRLVVVKSGTIIILDPPGEPVQATFMAPHPLGGLRTSPTLSADGRLFAWWDTKVMRVWDTATSTLAGPELPAKNGALRAFSGAGDRLAIVGFDRGELKGRVFVWNYRTGQQIAVLRSDAANFAPAALSFSPDGRRLAAGSEHLVIVWDVATAQEIFTFRGHRGNVADVAFSADGNYVASGGLDGIVRIWDVRPGDERPD